MSSSKWANSRKGSHQVPFLWTNNRNLRVQWVDRTGEGWQNIALQDKLRLPTTWIHEVNVPHVNSPGFFPGTLCASVIIMAWNKKPMSIAADHLHPLMEAKGILSAWCCTVEWNKSHLQWFRQHDNEFSVFSNYQLSPVENLWDVMQCNNRLEGAMFRWRICILLSFLMKHNHKSTSPTSCGIHATQIQGCLESKLTSYPLIA